MNQDERPALTSPVPIENFELFLGIIHQWNLYDFHCRGVQYAERPGTGATLDLDLFLHADNVRQRAECRAA